MFKILFTSASLIQTQNLSRIALGKKPKEYYTDSEIADDSPISLTI